MAAREGRCINFGRCTQADSGQVVVVRSGGLFVCPSLNCREPLEPVFSEIRSSPLRGYLLMGSMAAVIIVGGVLGYFWYSPAKTAATQTEGFPATSVRPAAATLFPAGANRHPAVANDSEVCGQTDWSKAKRKDFVAINCVGKEVSSYDKRLEYVYSLDLVKDWSSVKRDDPRLKDCAGLLECEQRAQGVDTSRPLPESRQPNKAMQQPDKATRQPDKATLQLDKADSHAKTVNWTNASCESVTQSWESEDPRLSTTTCDGLGLVECSHIKRCLGLHDVNLGPGSSKIQP